MPRKTSTEAEALVRAFSKEGLTVRAVVERLKVHDITMGRGTVTNIIRNVDKERKAKQSGLKPSPKRHPRPVRTK